MLDQQGQEVEKEVVQVNRLIQVQAVSPQEQHHLNVKIKLGNYVIDRDISFDKGQLRRSVLIERQVHSEQPKGSLSSTLFFGALVFMAVNHKQTSRYLGSFFRN